MALNPDGTPKKPDPAEFAAALINGDAMLSAATEWINDNMEPGDVFDDEKLIAWAQAKGFKLVED